MKWDWTMYLSLVGMLILGYGLGAWRSMRILTKSPGLYEQLRKKYGRESV